MIKKVLILAAAGLTLAACVSMNNNNTASSAPAAQSVTDSDPVNMEAPAYNYENNVSYEDQLRAAGTYIRGIRGKAADRKSVV